MPSTARSSSEAAGPRASARGSAPSDGRGCACFVFVFLHADVAEAGFLEDTSARRPIEWRMADDSFDAGDRARAAEKGAYGLCRIPTAPAGCHDGVADLDDAGFDESAADLADDHVVLRAMDEERTERAVASRVLADAGGELGRIVRGHAYVVGTPTRTQRFARGGADRAEDDRHHRDCARSGCARRRRRAELSPAAP